MDRAVIESKLESLRRCVARLRDRTPSDRQALERDADLQDIIALNLVRAVQVSTDIAMHLIAQSDLPAPASMGHSFQLLAGAGVIDQDTAGRMRSAVGFRNIAVQNCERIDWRIVHSILLTHLDDFEQLARVVSRLIDQP